MKKLASLVLAVVMALAMTMTVSAATISNATGHSYKAYQVFKGTQEAGSSVLGDIDWGNGVVGADVLTQLKVDYDYFDDCDNAMDVANVLKNKDDKCPEAEALANAAAMHLTDTCTEIAAAADSVELAAGYYLLVDTSDVDETSDARNSALLQVTNDGDITIEKKYTVPSVDKDIIEDGEEAEATDANIGDTINFQITGTLPSNYADYETYKYVFHDTMSEGLTYNNDAKVYVVNGEGDEATKAEVIFTVNASTDETTGVTTITITHTNLKTIAAVNADSKIVVEYTATVNSKAEIGQPGNPNEVYLEYTNDPNHSGEGEPTTGNTPEDKVLVFTYELDVTKVDGADETTKLKDAEFVLYRGEGDDVEYVQVNADGKVTGWTSNKGEASKLVSDEAGLFKVIGLDAGTYYLEETKAPAGYNLLEDPITVVISATVNKGEDTPALEALEITVGENTKSGDLDTGIVSTSVINNAGATLPETGGMGTTLFYIVGGALVLIAVVVLITKKRMSAEK